MLNEDSKYIGQCDNIRSCRFNKNNVEFFKNIDTEKWWEDTLKNSSEISKKEFLLNVNPHEILDSDESFDDFLINLSDTYNFYKTNNIYFIKTSGTNGFEWFWVINNSESINEGLLTNLLSHQDMLKLGATGSLSRAFERYIPLDKIEGLDPEPSTWGDGYEFKKGEEIKSSIEVIYDKDRDVYYLQNGNHRIKQAKVNGDKYIRAFIQPDNGKIGNNVKLNLNENNSDLVTSIICYHTSLEDFNIFDINKIGSMRNLDNVGFFFTKKEEDAKDFGDLIGRKKQQDFYHIYKCSVKINKPYTFKQFEEDFNGEYKTGYDGNLTSTFDLNKEFILDKIKGNNHDGLIFGNLIMCLKPNQIKIIDKIKVERKISGREKYTRTNLNESLNKKFITVYHGTKPKFVSSIKQNGLIDKSGYNQGWYVVSTDFESALFHSHPDEDKGDTNVIEFEVPINDNDKWLGYPYLWKGQKMNGNSTWFALMQKLPTEFITKIHTINYDTFMKQKNVGFSKINESLLTEKLVNVDSDVDLLYNKYFKTDIDELNRTGIIRKEMFEEYQGDNTNILNSEDSIKANETNRCELIINNRLGNAYRPSTKTIFLSANRNAINYVLNEFNGDYNNALDSLKGGNQYNSFKMEFTEERIKGSIHHELAHWIDDTNNNQHINKRTQIATKLGTRDINNIPVDSTKMEIQGQIHNIKQVYNKYKENWNELSLRDLFNLTPTLNIVFNNLKDSFKKQWVKDLILRMNRENLLGDKMRLNNYYSLNENTLNEENSDLKGTILKIVSPNIQKHLDDLIKQYGDKAEIIKHIVSAIDEKPEYSLTYEYAKKIKNYFDNFKGNNTSEEYQLHGGIKLKNYINLILTMKRDSISTGKDIRKNMTILNNTHLKSHDKSTIGLTRNPMALKEHIELIENYIPTKKASCGVILNPEKSILLVKRGVDTKWFPGKWALVGGKVDGDEEFKDAFIREVKEETNLDLDFIKYCYNKHDGDCEVALFVAITKTPNDIKINKEHSEYKWCTANEIKELDCVPHIYEDISECLKLLINNKEDLLAEEYKHSEYLSWKRKNVTIRGIKEAGQENNAGAMLGRGLYTAFLSNKELAKQYGTVKFVVNAIPKKAKVFNSLNEWEIFFYNTLIRNYCKEHGLKESRTNFSQNTTIEDEMQKLGFDGIIIKGREMVNYKPENVLYFGNENQLKFYYEDIT